MKLYDTPLNSDDSYSLFSVYILPSHLGQLLGQWLFLAIDFHYCTRLTTVVMITFNISLKEKS